MRYVEYRVPRRYHQWHRCSRQCRTRCHCIEFSNECRTTKGDAGHGTRTCPNYTARQGHQRAVDAGERVAIHRLRPPFPELLLTSLAFW